MHEDEVAGPAGYGVLVLRDAKVGDDVGGGWVVVEGNEGDDWWVWIDDWVVEHPTYGTVRLDGDEIEGDTREALAHFCEHCAALDKFDAMDQ